MTNRAPQHLPALPYHALRQRFRKRSAVALAALAGLLAGVAGCAPQPAAPRKVATVEPVDARAALGLHTRETRMEFGSQPKQIVAGEPALWSLKVLETKRDEEGRSAYIRTFDAGGKPLLRLVVVSQDLSYFKHLLPDYKDYGHFLIEPTLPRAGDYKLFAVYTPHGGTLEVAQHALSVAGATPLEARARLTASPMQEGWMIEQAPSVQPVLAEGESGVSGNAASNTLSSTQSAAYQVALMPSPSRLVAGEEAALRFQVRDNSGQPLDALQPLDGEGGYCIIVSQDSRIYLEARSIPSQSELGGAEVTFRTRFPVPGLFKVWGQFRHGEQVITAPFVLRVEAGTASRTKSS